MELDPDIAAHNGQGVERARLSISSRLEAERTWELLQRFLPAPPAVVFDVEREPSLLGASPHLLAVAARA